MKKILLIFSVVFAIKYSYSQTEKGTKFIGGNINLSGSGYNNVSSSSSNSKDFGIIIFPELGYFIKDNLALGLTGNVGITKSYGNMDHDLFYGAGMFCKKFIPINDNLKFFIHSGIGYSYSKTTVINFTLNNIFFSEAVSNSISANITPGLAYFATKKLAVSASIGSLSYSIASVKVKNPSFDYPNYITSYGLNLNNQGLTLGLNYFF